MRWLVASPRNVSLRTSPVDVAPLLGARWNDHPGPLVFTSATLSVGERFDYVRDRLGLGDAASEATFASPFRYSEQALVYLPVDLPDPNDERFAAAAAERALTLCHIAGGRALVLFTDGEDMVSHATAADVRARVERSATPVYVIAQGKGMREPLLKRTLDRVSGVSGGRSFYTDRIEELEGVFAEISEDIASQYLLAYTPGETPRDGSWRTIRVEVAGRGKDHAVRARQGYRALPPGR